MKKDSERATTSSGSSGPRLAGAPAGRVAPPGRASTACRRVTFYLPNRCVRATGAEAGEFDDSVPPEVPATPDPPPAPDTDEPACE